MESTQAVLREGSQGPEINILRYSAGQMCRLRNDMWEREKEPKPTESSLFPGWLTFFVKTWQGSPLLLLAACPHFLDVCWYQLKEEGRGRCESNSCDRQVESSA